MSQRTWLLLGFAIASVLVVGAIVEEVRQSGRGRELFAEWRAEFENSRHANFARTVRDDLIAEENDGA